MGGKGRQGAKRVCRSGVANVCSYHSTASWPELGGPRENHYICDNDASAFDAPGLVRLNRMATGIISSRSVSGARGAPLFAAKGSRSYLLLCDVVASRDWSSTLNVLSYTVETC